MLEKDYRAIADNIKKYRKLKNMTQEQLAFELDIDPQYYAQLEQCRRHFTLEKVIDCCDILNIRVEDIIPAETEDSGSKSEILDDINKKLAGATCKQLLLIDKLIDDITPYVK